MKDFEKIERHPIFEVQEIITSKKIEEEMKKIPQFKTQKEIMRDIINNTKTNECDH